MGVFGPIVWLTEREKSSSGYAPIAVVQVGRRAAVVRRDHPIVQQQHTPRRLPRCLRALPPPRQQRALPSDARWPAHAHVVCEAAIAPEGTERARPLSASLLKPRFGGRLVPSSLVPTKVSARALGLEHRGACNTNPPGRLPTRLVTSRTG